MSTTRTSVEPYPWLQERLEGLWDQSQEYIKNTPYMPYPGGSRVAGFSPMQLASQDFLQQQLMGGPMGLMGQFPGGRPSWGMPMPGGAPMAGMGTGINEARQAAGVAGGIAAGGMAPMVDPSAVSAQQVQTGDLLSGIDRYRDPFESQVVDQAMMDLDRSRQMAQVGNATAATQAGAFGGDRHAILEAETNRGFADQAARTAAQLRSQGFSRAADLAQSDALRGLQAGIANQGAGLQAGMANQGAGLSADMANQNAWFTGRGQQLQGAGLLSSLGGDVFNRTLGTADAMSRMGAQQQAQSQAMLDDDVSRFYEEREYPKDQIAFQQSLLTGFPAGMTQTTSSPFNWGSALFGAGALGMGLFGPGGAFNSPGAGGFAQPGYNFGGYGGFGGPGFGGPF